MKKKLFVALIAVVVVSAIVGSCFAVYAKDATPRTVALSTGDAVTLGITATESFSLTGLNPSTNKTLDVVLTATNVAKAEDGIQGRFTVSITAASASAADVALAAAINVAAAGTHNDSSAYTADKATLAAGDLIDLDNIPTTMVLTFSVGEEAFLAGAAEGQVNVSLSWVIVDNWTASHDAYYVVGTMTGWNITKDCLVLSTAAADLGDSGNAAVLRNIAFDAGAEFKIVKWNSTYNEGAGGWQWFSFLGGASQSSGAMSIGTGDSLGNAVVNTAGNYCIYQNGSGFYVGPYPEA